MPLLRPSRRVVCGLVLCAGVSCMSLPRHRPLLRRKRRTVDVHEDGGCRWGYEEDCREYQISQWQEQTIYSRETLKYSYMEQDFGSVAALRSSLKDRCVRSDASAAPKSSFICSDDFKYCRAKNVSLSRDGFAAADCSVNRPKDEDIVFQQTPIYTLFDKFHVNKPVKKFLWSECDESRTVTGTGLFLSPPGHAGNLYHFMEHLNAIYLALHTSDLIGPDNVLVK